MTARRALLLAGAIAAFCAASIAALWWFDRHRAATGGAAAAAAAPEEAGPPQKAAADATAAAAQPAALPAEPVSRATPDAPAGVRVTRSAPAAMPWERVPIATRLSDLGPGTARPVYDALAAVRAQVDTCFALEPVRVTGQDPGGGYQGPAVLVLRIESRDGGLDIVGSDVESRGTSSAETIACVRTVLESWPIPAEAAAPGSRYRLRYPLPE